MNPLSNRLTERVGLIEDFFLPENANFPGAISRRSSRSSRRWHVLREAPGNLPAFPELISRRMLTTEFHALSATRISYSCRRQEYCPVSRLSFIGHRQYIIGDHVISTASLIKSHPLLRLHSRIERNCLPIKHFRNHTLDSPSLLLVFLRAVLPKESAPSDNVRTSMQHTQSK